MTEWLREIGESTTIHMGVSVGTPSIHLILTPNRRCSVREKGKTDGAWNGTYYTVNDFPSFCVNWLIWRSDMSTLTKYGSLKGKENSLAKEPRRRRL